MAASPWIPFPPTVDTPGTTYPAADSIVWVRMRDFHRRPFRAKWIVSDPSCVIPVTAEDAVIVGFSVPWYALDAWHPL